MRRGKFFPRRTAYLGDIKLLRSVGIRVSGILGGSGVLGGQNLGDAAAEDHGDLLALRGAVGGQLANAVGVLEETMKKFSACPRDG